MDKWQDSAVLDEDPPAPATALPRAQPKPRRRRFNRLDWFFLAFYLAAPVAFAAWWLQPPVYQTTALIRIARSADPLLTKLTDRPADPLEFDVYRKTQSQLVKSRPVLRKVLAKPGVSDTDELKHQSQPAKWLESHLNVTSSADSEVMELSLWGYHPHGLAIILNTVQESYIEEFVNVEPRLRAMRLSNLKAILQDREEQIRSQRNVLRNIMDVVGGDATSSYEVADKQSEINLMQDFAKRISVEIQELEMELNKPPRVTVLSEAESAIETNWNRRVFIALGVGLAPLLLTTLLIVARRQPAL